MCIKPLVSPEAFQTALGVTENVSDKTVLAPSVYQISADFMSTAAHFQTAVRKKRNRVIRIEKKARDVVNRVKPTFGFKEENDQGDDIVQGFGMGLYDRLTNQRCRPSTLPNAEKLIDEFIQQENDEIASVLLKEDRRKLTPFEKRSFKAIKAINDNLDKTGSLYRSPTIA